MAAETFARPPALDPAFARFAADPKATVRPPPPHVPIWKVRAAADAAMIDPAPPPFPDIRDAAVTRDGATIPLRLYRPEAAAPLPVVVFAHGGGFVWGSIATHDGICRRLALASGAAVVSVGYRLAPEAPFPAAPRDVLAALLALPGLAGDWGVDASRVALCGDSAGGHIVMHAARAFGGVPRPLRHVALIYPALDPDCASASHSRLSDGPVLTSAAMRWFWHAYLGASATARDAQLMEADPLGLPPVTIVTAGADPLSDEGAAFARNLNARAIPVAHHVYPGAPHGFLSLDIDAATSRDCLSRVATALAAALREAGQGRADSGHCGN
jgi:acetyl esterase